MNSKSDIEIDGWLLNEVARKKTGKIITNSDKPIVDELECTHQQVCEIVICYLKKCKVYQRLFTISFGKSSKEFSDYRSCSLDEVGLVDFLNFVRRHSRFVWNIDPVITASKLIGFKKRLEKICTYLLIELDEEILQHFQRGQQTFSTNEM